MAENIEREAAIEAAKHAWAKNLEPSQYIEVIPATDVAPVVHGRWEKQRGIYHCSECGKAKPYDVQADEIEYFDCNYCPNCGARMNGDRRTNG